MEHSILNNIRVVLCNTSHSGNIGSSARAMKTMGITRLFLVNPKATIDEQAIALAASASDVLQNATICTSLDEALADTSISIALTARKREFKHKVYIPREIAPLILEQTTYGSQIALVFGSETNGLTIEEVEKCNTKVTIPANPNYSSLNLAQAVQVLCYEIYSQYNSSVSHLEEPPTLATFEDNQRILALVNEILLHIDFGKKDKMEILNRRIQNLLYKAKIDRDEMDLLMGMCKKLLKNLG